MEIIDAGVPTARAMSALFAALPPDARRCRVSCINPFDSKLLEDLDAATAESDGGDLAHPKFESCVGASDGRA